MKRNSFGYYAVFEFEYSRKNPDLKELAAIINKEFNLNIMSECKAENTLVYIIAESHFRIKQNNKEICCDIHSCSSWFVPEYITEKTKDLEKKLELEKPIPLLKIVERKRPEQGVALTSILSNSEARCLLDISMDNLFKKLMNYIENNSELIGTYEFCNKASAEPSATKVFLQDEFMIIYNPWPEYKYAGIDIFGKNKEEIIRFFRNASCHLFNRNI